MDLEKSIELLSSVKEQVADLEFGVEKSKIDAIRSRLVMLIEKIFDDNSYINELKFISFHPSLSAVGTSKGIHEKKFYEGKRKLLNMIDIMQEDIQLSSLENSSDQGGEKDKKNPRNSIFIVHGHNDKMKESVARVVEKLGLEPVILHEQPNKGRTIIEKFTDYSEVDFAIILLSADDFGYVKDAEPKNGKFRARQNVILELGFFLGKLGRQKVLALFETNDQFEFPSDYIGVLYTPFDSKGKWKFELVKELKANQFKVNANDIL